MTWPQYCGCGSDCNCDVFEEHERNQNVMLQQPQRGGFYSCISSQQAVLDHSRPESLHVNDSSFSLSLISRFGGLFQRLRILGW